MSGKTKPAFSKLLRVLVSVCVFILIVFLAYKVGKVFGHKIGTYLKAKNEVASEIDTKKSADVTAPEILRISDIDFPSYSRGLAKFVDLEIGEDFAASQAKMETYFVPGKGTSDAAEANERREGPAEASFSTFGADGGTVIVADRFNMADDSVKAEQMYAISKKQDGAEILVDFGMKLKCWRGEDPDAWGTDLCP